MHSSPHGRRVLEDAEAADGRTHRYTAPDADVGWDSHEGVFYLGYTFYNISWHSRELGVDLMMSDSTKESPKYATRTGRFMLPDCFRAL